MVIAAAAALAAGCATSPVRDHVGVRFHAEVGFAGNSSTAIDQGQTARFSGPGVAISAALGGAVAPNFIVGGEVWAVAVSEPKYRDWDGSSFTIVDSTYSVYGLGPQLTWFKMPANVYFSITPSLTQLSLSDDYSDESEESRWGYGVRAAIGKEWLVSPEWGIGVAGVGHFSSNEGGEDGPTWTSWGAGLVFSAGFD
jgi:hypothetical protein